MGAHIKDTFDDFIKDANDRDKAVAKSDIIISKYDAPEASHMDNDPVASSQIFAEIEDNGSTYRIIHADSALSRYTYTEIIGKPIYDTAFNLRTLIIKASNRDNARSAAHIIKFYRCPETDTSIETKLKNISEISTMDDFTRNKRNNDCYDIIPSTYCVGHCHFCQKNKDNSYTSPERYYFIIMDELPLHNILDLYKSYFNTAIQTTKCHIPITASNKNETAGTYAYYLEKTYHLNNEYYPPDSKVKNPYWKYVNATPQASYSVDYQPLINELLNKLENNVQNNSEEKHKERRILQAIRKKATRQAIKKIIPSFRTMLKKLDSIHTLDKTQKNRCSYIHFDLKPSNMLADDFNDTQNIIPKIYLIDWGSAVVNRGSINDFPTSSTAEYAVPHNNGKPVPYSDNANNAACDVFSLCAVLYNLITTGSIYNSRSSFTTENLLEYDVIDKRLKEYGTPAYVRRLICDGTIWNRNPNKQIKTAAELYNSMGNPLQRHFLYSVEKSPLALILTTLIMAILVVAVCFGISSVQNLNNSTTESPYSADNILSQEWEDETLKNLITRYNGTTISNCESIQSIYINNNTIYLNNSSFTNNNNTTIDLCYDEYDTDTESYRTVNPYIFIAEEQDKLDKKQDKYFKALKSSTQIETFNDIAKYFPNADMLVLENLNLPYALDGIEEMDSLRQVYLYNCNITSLESLKNVEEIYIWNCSESVKLSGIETLQRVRRLTLNGLDVDLSGIEKLEDLKYLDLSGCTFESTPLSLINNTQITHLLLDSVDIYTLESTLNAISGYTRIKTFVGRMNDYSDTCDKLTDILASNSSIEYVYLSDSVFSDMSGFEKLDDLASLIKIHMHRAKNINREIWTDYTPFDDYITKMEYSVPANSLTDVYVRNWYNDLSIWYNGIESSKKDQLAHIVYAGYDTVAVIGKQIYFCHSDTSDDYTGDTSLVGNVENDRFGSRINTDFYDFFNHYNLPSEPSEESISSATFLTQLFPNVRRLILSDCRIPLDCPELRQLDKLEEIYVDSCGTVDMKAFVDMPSLRYIHISAASEIINVEALKSSEMGFVAKLEIARCEFPVCDIPLSSGIYALHLYQIDLSTADLEHLQGVSYINSIYLSDCSIDDEQALLELIHQDNINDILINNNSSPLDSLYNILSEDGYYICKPFYSYNNNDEPEEINGIKISK